MVEEQTQKPEEKKPEEEKKDVSHKTYWAEVKEKTCAVVKCHKFCSIIGAIMIFGIIVAFYNLFAGGIFIGAALGAYYTNPIKHGLEKLYANFKSECYFNKFFTIIVAIALLITTFPLLIGGIIGVGVKSLLASKVKCDPCAKKPKNEK